VRWEHHAGKLTVWSSSMAPHYLRHMLSRMFDIPQGDIRTITPCVGGGFGVYFSPPDLQAGDDSPRVKFDPRYVLVDHLGIMRAEYRTGAPDPTLIARDVNLLLEEAANSDGVVRLGYEAAHLFLCYPR